ncbi:MAG: glycosyltransferase 87 family protein [Chloroflexota bacterium]
MAFKDIRKSNKLLSAADVGFVLGAFILIVGLLVLDIYLARTLSGGEWLFQRWSGVRAFLIGEGSPYGSAVAQRVQTLAYGREAYLNEYPYVLNDPFYIVLLYTPLSFFADFAIVRGIWMLLSQIALVGIVLLSLNLSEWKPPAWIFIILLGFGLFSYFSISALLSASPAIFLTLIYLFALVALRAFSDELAGALLCLAAYQWEIGLLFFLFVLAYVILNRRWRVFSGLGMTFILMMIVSLIANRSWIIPYFQAVRFDWIRGISYTFSFILSEIFPSIKISAGGWIALAGIVVLLYEATRSADEHARQVMWAAFLALALNSVLGFAIFPTNHIVLMPAIIMITALVWERWANQYIVVSLFLIGLIGFFYFGLYFEVAGKSADMYPELLSVLPPVLATLGLYWMRWWAIRPPRIWADQFGARK